MAKRSTRLTAKLAGLQALAHSPAEQAARAAEFLRAEKDVRIVLAALDVLRQAPDPAALQVLREKYEHYDANGPRRDSRGELRAALLRALRPVATQDDVALFERAARIAFRLFNGRGRCRTAAPPWYSRHRVQLIASCFLIRTSRPRTICGRSAGRGCNPD